MRFTWIVTAATVVVASATGSAGATTRVASPDGTFGLALAGRVKPARLAPRTPTPASFHIAGKVTRGEDPPSGDPEMRAFTLEADRNVSLDVAGVPVCRVLGLPVAPPPWNDCPDGVVGHGEVTILYTVPEGVSVQVSSEVVIYNGGVKHGLTNLWARAYFAVPIPNTSLARIKVRRIHRGRYGLEATVSIPRLADRFGTLRSFDLTLDRSIVSARCSDGRLNARGSALFETGESEVELPFSSVQHCTGTADDMSVRK